MNFSFDTLKTKIGSSWTSLLAFGDKNAPILMTGGGLVLGWTAAYFLWKESKDAEQKIKEEEEKLKVVAQEKAKEATESSDTKNDEEIIIEEPTLSRKEKISIYLQYCWLSLVLGIASTGLIIGGQKLSMDRIAQLYLLTKVLGDKIDKKDNIITQLKEKAGIKERSKADEDLMDDVVFEKYDESTISEIAQNAEGHGTTLFIDEILGHNYFNDIIKANEGVFEANKMMQEDKKRIVDRKLNKTSSKMKDPFFFSTKESPYPDDDDDDDDKTYSELENGIYSSLDFGTFLKLIGDPYVKDPESFRMRDILEFRYRWEGDLLSPSRIFRMRKIGPYQVCYVNYDDYLYATGELMDRSPL